MSHCIGCSEGAEEQSPTTKRYVVKHHDGSFSMVNYCADCADLARMDWNGNTEDIAEVAR
jgi:hypothetical protein